MNGDEIEADSGEKCWYLVGIQLHDGTPIPEFYTAILVNGMDRALTQNGRLCFFTNVWRAKEIVVEIATDAGGDQFEIDEVSCVCNIVETTRLLSGCDIDANATVLDTLNLGLDLLRSATVEIPDSYKQVLYAVADHCTFSRDLNALFKSGAVERRQSIEAVQWCRDSILARICIVG